MQIHLWRTQQLQLLETGVRRIRSKESTQVEEEALEAHTPIPEAVMQELYTVHQPEHLLDSPYIADSDGQAMVEAIREGWACRGQYVRSGGGPRERSHDLPTLERHGWPRQPCMLQVRNS